MAQSFTYTITTGTPGTTGKAIGSTPSIARELNAGTGDVVFDDTRATWATRDANAERIVRCLRTPKGTALRDLTYGLDMDRLDRASPTLASTAQKAIADALSRYVSAGLLTIDSIRVDAVNGRLAYEVNYRGPQSPVKGTL